MPEAPNDIRAYKERFFERLQESLGDIERVARDGRNSLNAALTAVQRLKPMTEHINQAHHEALCLAALQWLRNNHEGLKWFWQPTSTGAKDEADVEGRDAKGTVVVVAECSASIAAKGTLRHRMNSTLEKLSSLTARHKYYFAAIDNFANAAENRARKLKYDIIVRQLPVA